MPSNHCSNWDYHAWLVETNKHKGKQESKMKDWAVNISCDFKDVLFHCSESDIDDHVIEYIKSELLKGFEITIEEGGNKNA